MKIDQIKKISYGVLIGVGVVLFVIFGYLFFTENFLTKTTNYERVNNQDNRLKNKNEIEVKIDLLNKLNTGNKNINQEEIDKKKEILDKLNSTNNDNKNKLDKLNALNKNTEQERIEKESLLDKLMK